MMSKTFKHIKKFYEKRLQQISHNLKKQFGANRHKQFDEPKSKSIAELTKEFFDSGHF